VYCHSRNTRLWLIARIVVPLGLRVGGEGCCLGEGVTMLRGAILVSVCGV
jgi:hypothetical protein